MATAKVHHKCRDNDGIKQRVLIGHRCSKSVLNVCVCVGLGVNIKLIKCLSRT